MNKLEIALLIPESDQYQPLVEALKERALRLTIYHDLSAPDGHFLSTGHTRQLVVFIDSIYLPLIAQSSHLPSEAEEPFWIALTRSPAALKEEYPFLYDVLEWDNPARVDLFLNRLEQDLLHRMQLHKLQSKIDSIYEISKSLTVERDIKALLDVIIDGCMEITDSEGGTIYLIIDEANEWSNYSTEGDENKRLQFVISKNRNSHLNLEKEISPISRKSIAGYTVLTGRPLLIQDAYHIPEYEDYRFNFEYDRLSGYKTRSILSVPMKDQLNRILGVIQLINKRAASEIVPFDEQDEVISFSLAGQAAVALENSSLYSRMETLLKEYELQNSKLDELSKRILKAHEEERKRIARDIHDGPAQSIANAAMKIEILKKYLDRNMLDALSPELEDVNRKLKSTVKDVRKIIYDLKPIALDQGIFYALHQYLAGFNQETGIEASFHPNGDDTGLESYISSTLYRVVQEACNNIRKHSEARQAVVHLDMDDTRIMLNIIDDGKGFDTDDPSLRERRAEGGFGLEGLQERVELIEGSLSIQSHPRQGTRLDIVIPRKRESGHTISSKFS